MCSIPDPKGATDPMRTAYEGLLAVERDCAAHRLTVGGVHIWSAMRAQIFEKVMLKLGLYDRSLAKPVSRWSRLLALPVNLTLRNPFFRRRPVRNFVLKWVRVQPVEGQLDDIITRPLRALLPEMDTHYMHFLGRVPKGRPRDISIEAVMITAKVLSWLYPVRFSEEERTRIEEIRRAIEIRLNVSVDLLKLFADGSVKFRSQRDLFIKLFKRWRTRRLFVVVAYGWTTVVAAAKACSVEVIELQHGLVHRAHIGYDFPEGLDPAYRPDHLLLYGDYWRNAARHHPQTQLAIFGSPYMRKHLAAAGASASVQNQPGVLFLSQAGIFQSILDFALAFARIPNVPKTIFRLHPSDDVREIEARVAASGINSDKFELSFGGGGPRTLELQRIYRIQVGVFSTAVLEGLALGCRTFLIPVPGWSALSGLVESGLAELAFTPEDLASLVKQPSQADSIGDVALNRIFAAENPQVIENLLGGDR
jgi:hypothetical protein